VIIELEDIKLSNKIDFCL